MTHPSESEIRPATILVDVQLQKTAAEEHDASLQELRQLVETLGWDIVGTLTQKLQPPTAASLIGPGKLNELSDLVKAPSMAESVVFDHELTPTQVRNIREATGVEVYDRPAIILEIFHRHARTKEAQLQVELARLKYLAPRERVSGAKERRGEDVAQEGSASPFMRSSAGKCGTAPTSCNESSKRSIASKSSAVVIAKVCPRSPSSGTPTPESLQLCGRSLQATCSWPTGSLRPWIPPCERCTPRRNPGFSFPTRLVSFEISPTIWWPHSGRLSTKRWTPPFCFT